jgi:hypothetical protein
LLNNTKTLSIVAPYSILMIGLDVLGLDVQVSTCLTQLARDKSALTLGANFLHSKPAKASSSTAEKGSKVVELTIV